MVNPEPSHSQSAQEANQASMPTNQSHSSITAVHRRASISAIDGIIPANRIAVDTSLANTAPPRRSTDAIHVMSDAKYLPLRKRATKETDALHGGHSMPAPLKKQPILMDPHAKEPTLASSRDVGWKKMAYPPTPTNSHDTKSIELSGNPLSELPPLTIKEPVHSPRSVSPDSGETTETDEENGPALQSNSMRLNSQRRHSTSKQTVIIHPAPLQQQRPLASSSNTKAPMAPRTKPLKKAQQWSMSHQTTTEMKPPANVSETSATGRKLSWTEDDRPVDKNKRRRPPSVTTTPDIPMPTPFLTDPSLSLPDTPQRRPDAPKKRNGRRGSAGRSTGSTDETLYCICRKPYDAPRFMIACDRCDQWFHGECIGINEKEGEFVDLYYCPDCAKATGKKMSWKPVCANPACQSAARISSHQEGRPSKYCSDACGVQVARARLELFEMKRRADASARLAASEPKELVEVIDRQKRAHLLSGSTRSDRRRLEALRNEKHNVKALLKKIDYKMAFVQAVSNRSEAYCGFDTRLIWPDHLWQSVEHVAVAEEGQVEVKFSIPPEESYTICQKVNCTKHAHWKALKAAEVEEERHELFRQLQQLANERRQIRLRLRKRREEVERPGPMANITILHTSPIPKQ